MRRVGGRGVRGACLSIRFGFHFLLRLTRALTSFSFGKLFFHKYFSQKHEREKAKAAKVSKRRNKKDGSDSDVGPVASEGGPEGDVGSDEEDESDAEEAEIWKVSLSSGRHCQRRVHQADSYLDATGHATDYAWAQG